MKLFHERCGHLNVKDCAALAAQQAVRLTETVDFACDVCATAKQRKAPMLARKLSTEIAPGQLTILQYDRNARAMGHITAKHHRPKYKCHMSGH